MDDTFYHSIAHATLSFIADRLDAAYEAGMLEELEQTDSVLTITSKTGRTFVVSKHAPSQQIWLASPISGGLHFSYYEPNTRFELRDGRTLLSLLAEELAECGVMVVL